MGSPPPLLNPGQSFGPYLIDEVLGSGGMGAVYRVCHVETGAHYALKIILPRALGHGGDSSLRRFQREAQVLARVDDHPGIVRVHAYGEQQGVPWMALELVEGQSLRHRPPG